jgi:hypothetical protein
VADALVVGQCALAMGMAYVQSPMRAARLNATRAPDRFTAR